MLRGETLRVLQIVTGSMSCPTLRTQPQRRTRKVQAPILRAAMTEILHLHRPLRQHLRNRRRKHLLQPLPVQENPLLKPRLTTMEPQMPTSEFDPRLLPQVWNN